MPYITNTFVSASILREDAAPQSGRRQTLQFTLLPKGRNPQVSGRPHPHPEVHFGMPYANALTTPGPDPEELVFNTTHVGWRFSPGKPLPMDIRIYGYLRRKTDPEMRLPFVLSAEYMRHSFIPDLTCGQDFITEIAEHLKLGCVLKAATPRDRIEAGQAFSTRLIKAISASVRRSAAVWLPLMNEDLADLGIDPPVLPDQIEASSRTVKYTLDADGRIRRCVMRRASPAKPRVGDADDDAVVYSERDDQSEQARTAGSDIPSPSEISRSKEREMANDKVKDLDQAEKQPILIHVPYEERMKARAMGLHWESKFQSWAIPETMPMRDAAAVFQIWKSQTPQEAQSRAQAVRESQAYQEARAQRPARTEAAGKTVKKAERTEGSHLTSDRIPPYARLYLKPGRYSEQHRADLKTKQALFDSVTQRWCIDRRLPTAAFSSEIPDYRIIPYEDREEAKSLGAKWDSVQRSWYIPQGVDAQPFSRWPKLQDTPCRDYITVPKAEQAEARELGAFFDAVAKSCYIPNGADRKAFAKWSPSETEPVESRPIFRRRVQEQTETQSRHAEKAQTQERESAEQYREEVHEQKHEHTHARVRSRSQGR